MRVGEKDRCRWRLRNTSFRPFGVPGDRVLHLIVFWDSTDLSEFRHGCDFESVGEHILGTNAPRKDRMVSCKLGSLSSGPMQGRAVSSVRNDVTKLPHSPPMSSVRHPVVRSACFKKRQCQFHDPTYYEAFTAHDRNLNRSDKSDAIVGLWSGDGGIQSPMRC